MSMPSITSILFLSTLLNFPILECEVNEVKNATQSYLQCFPSFLVVLCCILDLVSFKKN